MDIKEYKGYVAQLSKYLDECPNFHTQLPEMEYTEKSLVILFQFYYECTNKKIEFEIEDEKPTFNFGVLGGISITSLGFRKDEDVLTFGSLDFLTVADYPTYTFITGGGYLDILFKRRLKRFSYYSELLFTQYKGEVEFENFSTRNEVDLGFSQLKLLNMVRFHLPIKEHELHLNVGVSLAYLFGLTNERIREDILTTTPFIRTLEAIESPRKFERGLVAGIGAKFGRISGDIQYERGNGISPYVLIGSPTNRIYFLIGYQF